MWNLKEGASRIGQATLLSLALAGCSDTAPKAVPQATAEQPKAGATANPGVLFSKELKSAFAERGMPETQTIKHKSIFDDGITTIENFAPNPIDEKAATALLDAVEVALSQDYAIPTRIQGKDATLAVGRGKSVTQNIFVLPDNLVAINALADNYPLQIQTQQPAYTLIDTRNNENTTVLRHLKSDSPFLKGPFFKTDAEIITTTFTIEACQRMGISVMIFDKKEHLTLDELVLAKELACNSFGLAIGGRAIGKSYAEYLAEASRRSLNVGLAGKPAVKGDFPYIVFPQNFYEVFPVTGTITK